MTNPVVKVAIIGKSTDSTDIRDYAFHSDYTCFKLDSIKSGSIIINAGSSTGSLTVSHSLGYVPAFLVYGISYYGGWELFPQDINCYATSTGITINKNLSTPYNQDTYLTDDYYRTYPGGDGRGVFNVGEYLGDWNGAIRFANLNINKNQTIISATLDLRAGSKGLTTSNLKIKTYGIDEDNTADFSSYLMGRTTTTANVEQEQDMSPSTPFTFGVNAKSIIEEITTRTNWSNGNALGFLVFDNGSANDIHILDLQDGNDATLTVTLTGSLTTNYKVVIFKDKIA